MDEKPVVSVVVLMKDKLNLIVSLICSFIYHCEYPKEKYTIYIGDTGSSDENKRLLKYFFNRVRVENNIDIQFIEYDYYNFAKNNNDIIFNKIRKDTKYVLLCNNDVELINDALSMVVNTAENNENVGTVGSRLMFPDNTIQHVGIKMTYYGIFTQKVGFNHILYRKPYIYKNVGELETWGNTGAFMLTDIELYKSIGGLNEKYEKCFEDVEYNLQCILKGKKNITNTDSLCWHRESSTRKLAVSTDDIKRINAFCEKKDVLKQKSLELLQNEFISDWIKMDRKFAIIKKKNEASNKEKNNR